MRVTMPTIFRNIQGNLQNLAEDLQKLNASIASGQKYQKLSDNPVEVGALLGLYREGSQTQQFERNLITGKSWLSLTESALEHIEEMVRAAMALANQMASGTYNAAQRHAAAQQVQGYIEEIMQMGNTSLNGHYIFGGFRTDTPPFVTGDWEIQSPVLRLKPGSAGTATSGGTYTGSASCTFLVEIVSDGGTGVGTYRVSRDGGQTWSATSTIPAGPIALGDGAEVTLGGSWTAGDRILIPVYQEIEYQGDDHSFEIAVGSHSRLAINRLGNETVGGDQGPNDLFQILSRLKSYLEGNDVAGVGEALENLRSYETHLTSILAGLGASLDRISIKENLFATLKNELTQQISTRGDTDMVEAVNLLKTKETAYQAALVSATKVMGLSLMDYL